MIVTEAEASKKFCPHQRMPYQGAGIPIAVNLLPHKDAKFQGAVCIGSKCMAWNWYKGHGSYNNDNAAAQRTGFCGLSNQREIPLPKPLTDEHGRW